MYEIIQPYLTDLFKLILVTIFTYASVKLVKPGVVFLIDLLYIKITSIKQDYLERIALIVVRAVEQMIPKIDDPDGQRRILLATNFFYKHLPKFLLPYVTKEQVRSLIEEAIKTEKEYFITKFPKV